MKARLILLLSLGCLLAINAMPAEDEGEEAEEEGEDGGDEEEGGEEGCVIEDQMNYKIHNLDNVTNPTTQESPQACAEHCAASEGGRFWTYNKENKACWLKTSDSKKKKQANAISGSRACGLSKQLVLSEEGEDGEGEEEGGEEDEEDGDGESIGCQNEGEGGLFGQDYEGNAAKTVSGLDCQKWSEQKPHKHKLYKDVGEHNFCRNPGADHHVVWCYTTDKKKRWEACDVPKCDIDCQADDGKNYKGEMNKTKSGKDCQDWAEQTPHKHKYKDVGENNFCRNPDHHEVWCYTTDKKKRWEACDVPKC